MYARARARAYTVGTVELSFRYFGDAPVAPPRPSMVMKSGCAYAIHSRSASICPAAIFIPIGRPSLRSLRDVTSCFKSSFVLISSNFDGEMMS